MESWKDWFAKIFLIFNCKDWLISRDPFIRDLLCSLNPSDLTLASDYSVGSIEPILLGFSSFPFYLPLCKMYTFFQLVWCLPCSDIRMF